MKNKKGFTLVELLAIITIVGIVSLIAVSSISEKTKNDEEQAQNTLNFKIENAAKLYAAKYRVTYLTDGTKFNITLNTLIEKSLLNLTAEQCSGDVRTKYIVVERKNGKTTYNYDNITNGTKYKTYTVTDCYEK